jgi:hypothetical protein
VTAASDAPVEAVAELDRQVQTLVDLGYPALAGLSTPAFRALLEPLRPVARALGTVPGAGPGRAPLVLVVSRDLLPPEATVPLLRLPTRGTRPAPPGVVDRNHEPGSLATYGPLDVLALPEHPAYLLVDVDRGHEFCGVRPQDALPVVLARGRTPLTIDEGIALVTHAPHLLERNHCFVLAGSRRADRRVPALWISGRAPKLGWCWDGNPHSWLGLASARERRGPVPILAR